MFCQEFIRFLVRKDNNLIVFDCEAQHCTSLFLLHFLGAAPYSSLHCSCFQVFVGLLGWFGSKPLCEQNVFKTRLVATTQPHLAFSHRNAIWVLLCSIMKVLIWDQGQAVVPAGV